MKYSYIYFLMLLMLLVACDKESRVLTIPDDLRIVAGKPRNIPKEETKEDKTQLDSTSDEAIGDSTETEDVAVDSTETTEDEKTEDVAADFDAEEIVNKHLKAVGAAKMAKMKNLKLTAKVVNPNQSMPLVSYIERPDKYRIDLHGLGATKDQYQIQVLNGNDAWKVESWLGKETKPASEAEKKEFRESCDFEGEFWNWKQKGGKLTADGYEELDGAKHYKVKLVKKDGLVTIASVHPETFYITQQEKDVVSQGQNVTIVQVLTDYKNINGMSNPMTTTQKYQGRVINSIVLEKLEYNVVMPDSLFTQPK
jgi:hypothetical protein